MRKILYISTLNLVIFIIFCIFLEGLLNYLEIIKKLEKPISERAHTKYDSEIGWVNIPNKYIPNMYGPNVYIKTNSKGFRNNVEFSKNNPTDRTRIICSGDSMTFGYGVDNENTWCQILTKLDNNLETINMGLGGYGIDQSYLLYKRNGTIIDHDIHLFSFITNDFLRMKKPEFLGYGKPVLKINEGKIVVENVPVPRRTYYMPWIASNRSLLQKLQTFRVISSAIDILDNNKTNKLVLNDDEAFKVLAFILKNLKDICLVKQCTPVFIHLPVPMLYEDQMEPDLREYMKKFSIKNQLIYIDLTTIFDDTSGELLQNIFFQEGESDDRHAAGHYTSLGNSIIAETVLSKLVQFNGIKRKILNKNKQ